VETEHNEKQNEIILILIRMKTFKTIAILVFCIGLLFSATSCAVIVKKDNGKHSGWHKNPKKPPVHHNHHITNPGKSKAIPQNNSNMYKFP
jgi:hypothetical protein